MFTSQLCGSALAPFAAFQHTCRSAERGIESNPLSATPAHWKSPQKGLGCRRCRQRLVSQRTECVPRVGVQLADRGNSFFSSYVMQRAFRRPALYRCGQCQAKGQRSGECASDCPLLALAGGSYVVRATADARLGLGSQRLPRSHTTLMSVYALQARKRSGRPP